MRIVGCLLVERVRERGWVRTIRGRRGWGVIMVMVGWWVGGVVV